MIPLKRLNGEVVYVNPDHIRFIHASPDTVITFQDGKTLLVSETADTVAQLWIDLRKATLGKDATTWMSPPSLES